MQEPIVSGMNHLITFLLALGLGSFAPALTAQTGKGTLELTQESFDTLRDLILPKADELGWAKIQWHASLGTAIEAAREANKPILLWAMNGHPLGCV